MKFCSRPDDDFSDTSPGHTGNYLDWDKLLQKCTGYHVASIIEKTKESLLKVKNGQAVYERDSVLFSSIEYSWPVLAYLLKIALLNEGSLRVLDFGGSLGSTYYQNRYFFDSIKFLRWCIVEQTQYVKIGKEHFEDGRLIFYEDIASCLKHEPIDVILMSGVLPVICDPHQILEQIVNEFSIGHIIIDRTPILLEGCMDRLTIQNVPEHIYKASYPAWFFNREKLLGHFLNKYILFLEFNGLTGDIVLKKPEAFARDKGFIFNQYCPVIS